MNKIRITSNIKKSVARQVKDYSKRNKSVAVMYDTVKDEFFLVDESLLSKYIFTEVIEYKTLQFDKEKYTLAELEKMIFN